MSNVKGVLSKFHTIEHEMNEFFIERQTTTRGLLLALVAKQNVVFIGPPGTGKSLMVRNLSSRIITDSEEDYFEWLMTKFTKPEEILGPMNIKKLVEGQVEFIPDYKLPRAKIVYLDEIFKCNSSLLNCLLSAINEKIIFSGNKPRKIPLEMLVGTSNEIPTDESLKALYDRFRLRYETEYIKEPSNLTALMGRDPNNIKSDGAITMGDIAEARRQVDSFILFSEEKQKLLCKIVLALNESGNRPSDRTINNVVPILKAEAWMNQNDEIQEYDMEILEHVFWDEPKKRREVRSIIFKIINPIGENVIITYEKCHQAYLIFLREIKTRPKNEHPKVVSENLNSLKTLYKSMKKDIEAMDKENRPTARYESMAENVLMLITDMHTDYVGVE